MVVVYLFEVYAATLVEEYIGGAAYYLVLLGGLSHLVVVEVVPVVAIQRVGCVVAGRELALMV